MRFMWPGQQSMLYPVLEIILLYCSGGVAGWSRLIGFYEKLGSCVQRLKLSSYHSILLMI